ncbi:MAG TPA: EamA family transporter, partial [Actinomycetes bacterium]|nr:EamA family transporter [Actinomycetes bacterium]
MSFGQLLAGTLLLAPVAAVDVAAGRVHLGPWAALCLVLLGTLGTGYAYLLNYRTLQESGATVASLVTYLVPLVAVAAVDLAAGRVDLGPSAALCLVLLGSLGTGYAYLLNYRTLQESGATVASLV